MSSANEKQTLHKKKHLSPFSNEVIMIKINVLFEMTYLSDFIRLIFCF